MHELLSIALNEAFPQHLRERLIAALKTGSDAAAARHAMDPGCNCYTLGYDFFHLNTYRLSLIPEDSTDIELEETSNELEFRMKVGQFTMACHRVGANGDVDIEFAFPGNNGGAGRLARQNEQQLALELNDSKPTIPRNVVLAYMANEHNGLEAVYLAVPDSTSDSGRINHWAYSECIWRIDGMNQLPAAPDLPAPVVIDRPSVHLRIEQAEGSLS